MNIFRILLFIMLIIAILIISTYRIYNQSESNIVDTYDKLIKTKEETKTIVNFNNDMDNTNEVILVYKEKEEIEINNITYIPPYTEEEVYALALTLAGECYDFEEEDKRNVAWVVCNRVEDDRFDGSDIIGVLSSKKYGVQFMGYWKQSRPISNNDYLIAEEVLKAWFNGETAPHDFLYFFSGKGTTNSFR